MDHRSQAVTIDTVASTRRNSAAILTIGDRLYWAYANLAMAQAAVESKSPTYMTVHYMVRSRLYSGLRNGTMKVGSLAHDDRMKMILPQACTYCGSRFRLAADHLIPRKKGGPDSGDNLVWACRTCNSSKCGTDALEWLARRHQFPPLLLLRRYLKLAIELSVGDGIMNVPISAAPELRFALNAIPSVFPPPGELVLWVASIHNEPIQQPTADRAPDPVIAALGLGAQLWQGESGDEFIERLRADDPPPTPG